jgi:hypothetical protein
MIEIIVNDITDSNYLAGWDIAVTVRCGAKKIDSEVSVLKTSRGPSCDYGSLDEWCRWDLVHWLDTLDADTKREVIGELQYAAVAAAEHSILTRVNGGSR